MFEANDTNFLYVDLGRELDEYERERVVGEIVTGHEAEIIPFPERTEPPEIVA